MSATVDMIQPMALVGRLATNKEPTRAKAPNPTQSIPSSTGCSFGSPARRWSTKLVQTAATYKGTISHLAARKERKPSARRDISNAAVHPCSLLLNYFRTLCTRCHEEPILRRYRLLFVTGTWSQKVLDIIGFAACRYSIIHH